MGDEFYVCAEFTTGYLLNMRICGEFPALENTVKNLTRLLTEKYRRLYMDNYYNSFSMTKALISSEIYVCETLRDRRGGSNKLTTLKKALVKDTQAVFSKSEVEVLISNNRRPVAMITNCHDTRCVISDKEKTIPSCINEYNKYMGGVDKFDQMIKYYPIKRKTNRWPNKFTMHTLQILIHNAYVLYKEYCSRQN
ncbi:PiggyBac transposable element-derived protein 4 [Cucumispora dikerogammari]|nr:PiggyBac transposable element-derived protein 4 [Cucumispora dikerogammari]